jgi:hypothetical protein
MTNITPNYEKSLKSNLNNKKLQSDWGYIQPPRHC